MYKFLLAICIHILLLGNCFSVESLGDTNSQTPIENRPIVEISTSMGSIIIRLFPDKAPLSCKNFLQYVEEQFYDETLIHRVIDGFLIQGGGFSQHYVPKLSRKPIKNESFQGIPNTKGTVAMALTTDINSAASQFFINLVDNPELNYSTSKRRGYTVFAEVINGEKTLHEIKRVRTRRITIYSELYKRTVPLFDTPEIDIIIEKVRRLR